MNTQIEKRLKIFEKKGIDRRYFFKQMAMAGLLTLAGTSGNSFKLVQS